LKHGGNTLLNYEEATTTLIFVDSRCSDLPKLFHVCNLLFAKYGKEFGAAAVKLQPDCGVNRKACSLYTRS